MEDTWEIIRLELKKELPPELYEPCIRPLRLKGDESESGERIVLETLHESALPQLRSRCLKPIENKLRSLTGRAINVQFQVPTSPARRPNALNPAYSFDRFLINNSNELAYIAAESSAEKPGRSNPLYIFGDTGLGKTHLAHAVLNRMLQENPKLKIGLLSLGNFRDDFFTALDKKSALTFRKNMKSYDVLCLEDIQLLKYAGAALQEEFYYVFNDYLESSRQIVFTSELPASDLKISERLLSRLLAGLTVKLDPPDKSLRYEFLRRGSLDMDLKLKNTTLEFISERLNNNIRSLESALNKLYFLKLRKLDLNDRSIFFEHISELASISVPNTIPVERIIDTVSSHYKLNRSDILGASRKSCYTLPRHIAMYLAVRNSGLNKSAIARCFRRNDHSTVINAEKNIAKKIAVDPEISAAIDCIEYTMRSGQ